MHTAWYKRKKNLKDLTHGLQVGKQPKWQQLELSFRCWCYLSCSLMAQFRLPVWNRWLCWTQPCFGINYTVYPLQLIQFYAPCRPSPVVSDIHCCESWALSHFCMFRKQSIVLLSFLARGREEHGEGNPSRACINISFGVKAIMKLKYSLQGRAASRHLTALVAWKLLLCGVQFAEI